MKNFLYSMAGTVVGGILLVSALALSAPLPLPGGGTGPQLGDPVTNLFSLTRAYTQGSGYTTGGPLSVSQTATQAACTQLAQGPGFAITQIGTSAGTGSICLPTAQSGNFQVIYNNTGSTIDIFGSNTFFTAGTQDTINNVTGSTAYAGLTTQKTTLCYAAANGKWACGSIS